MSGSKRGARPGILRKVRLTSLAPLQRPPRSPSPSWGPGLAADARPRVPGEGRGSAGSPGGVCPLLGGSVVVPRLAAESRRHAARRGQEYIPARALRRPTSEPPWRGGWGASPSPGANQQHRGDVSAAGATGVGAGAKGAFERRFSRLLSPSAASCLPLKAIPRPRVREGAGW